MRLSCWSQSMTCARTSLNVMTAPPSTPPIMPWRLANPLYQNPLRTTHRRPQAPALLHRVSLAAARVEPGWWQRVIRGTSLVGFERCQGRDGSSSPLQPDALHAAVTGVRLGGGRVRRRTSVLQSYLQVPALPRAASVLPLAPLECHRLRRGAPENTVALMLHVWHPKPSCSGASARSLPWSVPGVPAPNCVA